MEFWNRLFRHSKVAQSPIVVGANQETEATEIFEQSLRQHLARITPEMTTGLDALLSPNILDFTTRAIDQELRKSLTDHLHHHRAKRFGDLYVAVSTIPAGNMVEARTWFGCGYSAFLEVLFNECDYGAGDVNLAHWIICYDQRQQQAVNLTYLPSLKTAKTQGVKVVPVVALDLLTMQERSDLGVA